MYDNSIRITDYYHKITEYMNSAPMITSNTAKIY